MRLSRGHVLQAMHFFSQRGFMLRASFELVYRFCLGANSNFIDETRSSRAHYRAHCSCVGLSRIDKIEPGTLFGVPVVYENGYNFS